MDQRSTEHSNTDAPEKTYPVVTVGARSTFLLCSAVVVQMALLSALARVVFWVGVFGLAARLFVVAHRKQMWVTDVAVFHIGNCVVSHTFTWGTPMIGSTGTGGVRVVAQSILTSNVTRTDVIRGPIAQFLKIAAVTAHAMDRGGGVLVRSEKRHIVRCVATPPFGPMHTGDPGALRRHAGDVVRIRFGIIGGMIVFATVRQVCVDVIF